MVKNVRWLYAKLGNEDFSTTGQSTVTGALSSLQSDLDGKSNESHTHDVGSLPVSNNQVNSTSYIPTSALLYSMSQRADGIESMVNTAKRALLDDPNTRYESKDLGTWSRLSDVDTFLSQYTHENNYDGLSIGNYIWIQEDFYNAIWKIAGFDIECGQMAADGTIYDNGYGICLVPEDSICTGYWNLSSNTTGGYKSSNMHNTKLPRIATDLKATLGDHLVNRNVLLSSAITGNNSSAYTWTTADATLMSFGQMTGTFASNNNKYDDGEANYKLPLFDHEGYTASKTFWIRGISNSKNAWYINTSYGASSTSCGSGNGVRPLIYIR